MCARIGCVKRISLHDAAKGVVFQKTTLFVETRSGMQSATIKSIACQRSYRCTSQANRNGPYLRAARAAICWDSRESHTIVLASSIIQCYLMSVLLAMLSFMMQGCRIVMWDRHSVCSSMLVLVRSSGGLPSVQSIIKLFYDERKTSIFVMKIRTPKLTSLLKLPSVKNFIL